MHDTMMGEFKDLLCSDCSKKKVVYRHWGRLVPPGEVGYFCVTCMNIRRDFFQEHGKPKAMGNANPLV